MPFVHSRCESNALGILYLAGKIQIDDRHGQYRAIDVPSVITTENIRKTQLAYCKMFGKSESISRFQQTRECMEPG